MSETARSVTLAAFAALAIALFEPGAATAATINEFPLPSATKSYPYGICLGPDGALWFTEAANPAKIGRITTSGDITEFPLPTVYSAPFDICVGPDGALWFTENNVNTVGRITTSGTVTEFPIPTANSNSLGICLGGDGNLWFAEYAKNKIGRITAAGVVTEFVIPTANSFPRDVCLGPDGNVWFTEGVGKIGRITPAGVITEFDVPTGALGNPYGICLGPDGALWFTEEGFSANRIGRITTAGSITEFPLGTFKGPTGITSGSDGNLWFTELDADKIGRITPAGVITEFPVAALSNPSAICLGPDGAIWFTQTGSNNIGRIWLGLLYYTLSPCRVLDTRIASGPLGGPALGPNQARGFPFAGVCGIPSDAVILSGNITAVAPSAPGDLRAYAADQPVPPATVLNFNAGNVRANNLLVALSVDGTQSVTIQNDSLGTVAVVFDVNGYFK